MFVFFLQKSRLPRVLGGGGSGVRIGYNELSGYEGLKPGMGTAKWKSRSVCVVSSVAGRVYDTARFVGEMEALASAKHPHLAEAMAVAYCDATPTALAALPDSPALGQRPGCAVPQLVAVFEFPHGATLADTLRRYRCSAP